MATYNGILKKWDKTNSVWDTLYPKTTAANIISGILDEARIPSLNANKIGSGTINAARLPAIAITNSVTYTTLSAFKTAYAANHDLVQLGDIVILTTDKKTYIHNGGTQWTEADLTLLQTPTDAVTSVNGFVGVVDLEGSDIGIGGSSGNYYGNQDTIADSLRSVDAKVATNVTNIDGKAPKSHSSAGTAYGLGTTAAYGHVKTIDALTQNSHINGTALSAYQGYLLNNAIAGKEPSFSKKSAFNKNFGITTGTVCEGDDARLMNYVDRNNGKFGIQSQNCFEMTGQITKVHNDGELVMVINESGDRHNMVSRRLVNVDDPILGQDAATKNYVDTHQLMLLDALPTTGLVDGQMGFEY